MHLRIILSSCIEVENFMQLVVKWGIFRLKAKYLNVFHTNITHAS